jgi:L-aspartate oxidase
VLRDAAGLARAAEVLASVGASGTGRSGRDAYELANLNAIASAVTLAASTRTESRGGHRRADHPDADPAWRRHLSLRAVDGVVRVVGDREAVAAWA